MENRRKISTFVCLFYWFRGMALNAWELAKTKTFFNNNLYLFLNSNGEFRDNPVSGGNGGASHQRGHDLQGGA